MWKYFDSTTIFYADAFHTTWRGFNIFIVFIADKKQFNMGVFRYRENIKSKTTKTDTQ